MREAYDRVEEETGKAPQSAEELLEARRQEIILAAKGEDSFGAAVKAERERLGLDPEAPVALIRRHDDGRFYPAPGKEAVERRATRGANDLIAVYTGEFSASGRMRSGPYR
jgi:hypothetical protein